VGAGAGGLEPVSEWTSTSSSARRTTATSCRCKGGRYWYTAGVNWLAIGSWFVGAALAYVWAYVWPLPFGSTAPAFIVTFVLYLAVSWHRRPKGAITPVGNLASEAGSGRSQGMMSGCCET